MRLARFAGLDNEADRGAQTLADQVMMHGGCRQQGRDRNAIRAHHAVRQHDDVIAALDGRFRALAQALDRRFHPRDALVGRIGDVERLGVEGIFKMPDAADLFEIAIGQDRLANLKALALRIALVVEQVGTRSDEGHEAHDELFADRIDRRVRHLREVLLEISIKQLRLVRHGRDRRVGAHRADGFLAGDAHRREQDRQVFLRIAEGLLAIEQRHIGARGARLDALEVFEHDLRAVEPFAIGMRRRQIALHLFIGDDTSLLEINEQHFSRLQAPFGDDLLFRNRQHAHFGGHHDKAIVGDDVACGAQAVAVERRADLASVGEGDSRGAVPRLHQRRVIFIEGAALLIHQRIAGPGFGNEHHHRVRQRIAALHEEFECIVEAGGVRLALIRNRPEFLDVVTKQVGGDRGLPRRHPVHIAAQCVDLAVMGDHAVGMRQRPGRERVGRKALVDERKRRFHALVAQVQKIITELGGQQHALVDERARGQRDGIVALRAHVLEIIDGVRDHLAQQEQLALKGFLVGRADATTDENLLVHGLGRLDALAQTRRIDRHIAPAQKQLAFGGDHVLDDLLDNGAAFDIARQEQGTDGIISLGGKGKAKPLRLVTQEAVGDLHQHAAAVASLGVRADRTAMIEVQEDFETLGDNVMRLAIVQVGHEADAARILLIGGIVEAMGGRQRVIVMGGGLRHRLNSGKRRKGGGKRRAFRRTGFSGHHCARHVVLRYTAHRSLQIAFNDRTKVETGRSRA